MSGVDLPDGTSGIFFAVRLDDPNQLESVREIDVYAQAISVPIRLPERAACAEIVVGCVFTQRTTAVTTETQRLRNFKIALAVSRDFVY
jgi:hypothetical protein